MDRVAIDLDCELLHDTCWKQTDVVSGKLNEDSYSNTFNIVHDYSYWHRRSVEETYIIITSE